MPYLHSTEIYGKEVFNKADDLIEDSPSLPYAPKGNKMMQRRKRGSSKFRRSVGGRISKGGMKGNYTYKPKGKPQEAKVNAAVSISSSTSANEVTPTLSEADQRNLISLYYVDLGAPPPEQWNGEGGTVSEIVRALSYGKDQGRRGKEVIANYHFTILVGGEYNP